MASIGIDLSGVSVRLAVAALALAGLALPWPEPEMLFERREVLGALGAGGALLLGLLIQRRVIGEMPVPGNDWAKYVLYADEIARHGALLIDNPFWMLGVPFREDPGVPALYGAHLLMTGRPAAVLQQGIGLFALAQIAALYALARSLWGGLAGVVAALLWAALPVGYTLLGWHGLANAASLALLALMLLYLAAFTCSRLDFPAAVGAGLVMVGLAAAHRLSFGIAVMTAGLCVVAALALSPKPNRSALLWKVAIAATAGLALGAGVIYDLLERNGTFGGTQDHTAYLSSKIDLELLVRDLTVPFAVAGIAALVAAPLVVRRRRSLLPIFCLLAVLVFLGYSWMVELPLHYTRMVYFVPLALVPAIAATVGSAPRRVPAGVLAVGLALATAVAAWSQADDIRRFYRFADDGSVRGLGHLSSALRPNEVVVTDRCWSFLGTWLLHTPTLPALDPVDIQPAAELPFARRARAVLEGGSRGRAITRKLGIRYAIVDPTCPSATGEAASPSRAGRPVFVSGRLVVLRIGRMR